VPQSGTALPSARMTEVSANSILTNDYTAESLFFETHGWLPESRCDERKPSLISRVVSFLVPRQQTPLDDTWPSLCEKPCIAHEHTISMRSSQSSTQWSDASSAPCDACDVCELDAFGGVLLAPAAQLAITHRASTVHHSSWRNAAQGESRYSRHSEEHWCEDEYRSMSMFSRHRRIEHMAALFPIR